MEKIQAVLHLWKLGTGFLLNLSRFCIPTTSEQWMFVHAVKMKNRSALGARRWISKNVRCLSNVKFAYFTWFNARNQSMYCAEFYEFV